MGSSSICGLLKRIRREPPIYQPTVWGFLFVIHVFKDDSGPALHVGIFVAWVSGRC